MPLWLQHTFVLSVVGACLAYAVFQAVRTVFGKPSRMGSCCAKGCPTTPAPQNRGTERIVFLPADLLRKRK
jgi:hypothetical protein